MRIAVLIQCHKDLQQVNFLLDKLAHPQIDCYVHVDKKADFADKILRRKNVFVLPEEKRVSRMGKNITGRCNDKSFVSFYFWGGGMTITG